MASRTSLRLPRDFNNQLQQRESHQTLFFLPVQPNLSSGQRKSAPEVRYFEQGVKFYQAFALAPDLGLWSALCAVCSNEIPRNRFSIREIRPPNKAFSRRINNASSRYIVEDSFIVLDALVTEDSIFSAYSEVAKARGTPASSKSQTTDDARLRLSWSGIFQQIFLKDNRPNHELIGKDQGFSSTSTIGIFLQNIKDTISNGRDTGSFGKRTL